MSGESVLAVPKKKSPGHLEAKLQVENDRRLFGCAGSGSVLGAAFMGYALTMQVIIPRELIPEPPPGKNRPGNDTTFIKPPADYHRRLHSGEVAKHPARPAPGEKQAAAPRTPHPSQANGALRHDLIGSRSERSDYSAMDLLGRAAGHLDLDKLTEVGMLTRTGETRLAGRRGRTSETPYDGFVPGGNGPGTGPDIGSPPSGSLKPIGDLHPKHGAPRQEIAEMQSRENLRSSAAILAVVRAHAPGLRHLYNGFLRLHPGLRGKVTLIFAIAPSGRVIDAGLAGSTTGEEDFDAQVVAQVRAWAFDPIAAQGNDEVTVPFNFSE